MTSGDRGGSSGGGGGGSSASSSAASSGGGGAAGRGGVGGGAGSASSFGRERAIETILDRDPMGCYYRAARVAEESVPQLHSCRPNLITRAALVEQAWSLREFEYSHDIDAEFGGPAPSSTAATTAAADDDGSPAHASGWSLDGVTKERVVHHLERSLRSNDGGGGSSAPAKFACRAAAALKAIYEESLHKGAKPPASVDEALLSLSKSQGDIATVQSAVLSLLTIVEDAVGEEEVASDEEAEVNLPVAHLLALLESGTARGAGWGDNDLRVPREWLAYFAQAAAVAEERREIQRARMLARLPSPVAAAAAATPVSADAGRAGVTTSASAPAPADANANATPAASTPASSSSPTPFGSSSLSPPDELLAAAAAAQALSAAFEQVISRSIASTLRDSARAEQDEDHSSNAVSDDDDDEEEEEDDDDDDDEEEEEEDDDGESEEEDENEGGDAEPGDAQPGDPESAVHDDPGGAGTVVESSRGGVDETTISEFDEDTVLRQALQLTRLSLAGTAPGSSAATPIASRSDVVSEEDVIVVDDEVTSDRAQAELDELLRDEDDDVSTLPSMPTPPSTPLPFGVGDGDSSLDPSALSRFGSIPLPQVLLHLLQHCNKLLLESTKQSAANSTNAVHAVATTPGGMGCRLFGSSTSSDANTTENSTRDDDGLELQLIVASLLLVLERRDDAIAGLQRAVLREQQRDMPSAIPAASLYASAVVEEEEEEEDDPADTLAMNYVEDDVELTSESLENKGMRRKAAAAAYDAAALLKSLQKRTQAAKDATRLYSVAALYALRTLRLFLISHPRVSIQVAPKLSSALASLLSVSEYATFTELVPNEDVKIFLPLDLYREALWTWGECVPILIPFDESLRTLRSLIEDFKHPSLESISSLRSIDSLETPPVAELESKLHKLQVLCRRLRVSDMLDLFVPKPAHLLQIDEEVSTASTPPSHDEVAEQVPSQMSSTLSMLSESRHFVPSLAKADIEQFYLALCHRYHVRVFLIEGLIEDCLEHPTSSSRTPRMLSSGDTLKVAAQPGPFLQFDASKCADSMAIISDSGGNGPTVNQRASKVWGSVLATQYFNPKSGIHRFAVRLDKCERGHVFVGVSTMQASVKTYVGGDKHGWGMIGTQALWHDRRKIRGDYGATFRTGSTIVVTLDTDTGTLSFSTWKDSSSTNSFSLVSSSQGFSSPRRSGQVHGTVEDWGVAFEGLPLDSKLYPAVGLYQRDDKVTLLSVENGSGSAVGEVESGCFFPRHSDASDAARVRKFNDVLTWDAAEYATQVLNRSTQALQERDHFFVSKVLPSLASSLSLLPRSIPILSSRFAYVLLPHLQRCLTDVKRYSSEREVSDRVFCAGPTAGKWAIRASSSASSATECEEYLVDIEATVQSDGSVSGFEGKGVGTIGKSKNGRVSIVGSFSGSLLTFIEEWSDGVNEAADEASSCVATARLSLDGKRFEGHYENVQFGTCGSIAGLRISDSSRGALKDAPSLDSNIILDTTIASCEALLSLAISHLATILGEDCAGDHEGVDCENERMKALRLCLSGPLLSDCSLPESGSFDSCDESAFISRMYAPPKSVVELQGIPLHAILGADKSVERDTALDDGILDWVNENDELFLNQSGGAGSFSKLCHEEFGSARRRMVAVILRLSDIGMTSSNDERVEVWSTARRLTEDVTRASISTAVGKSQRESCKAACSLVHLVTDFLLSLDRVKSTGHSVSLIANALGVMFRVIGDADDIERLRNEMSYASRRAVLRSAALDCVTTLLREESLPCSIAIEGLTVGLPQLLGRGHIDYQAQQCNEKYPDLDGTYLHGLSGASVRARTTLCNGVRELFRIVGGLLDQASRRPLSQQTTEYIDSLILSLLALCSGGLGGLFSGPCERESAVLVCLPRVLSQYRPIACAENGAMEHNDSAVACRIRALCQRDRARSILLGVIGVTHVVTYQAAKNSNANDVVDTCLAAIRSEMDFTIPHLARVNRRKSTVGDDLQKWSRIWSAKKETSTQRENHDSLVVGMSGLQFLHDYGSSTTSAYLFGRQSGAVNFTPQYSKNGKPRSDFVNTYFSQLIHVLCCSVRFGSSLQIVASDSRWIESLFRAVGMKVVTSDGGTMERLYIESEIDIPARFRSRILRPLLSLMQASEPNRTLSDGIFVLAGYSSYVATQSLDEDEWLVSREAVTVLRNLHSIESPLWRECVNNSISDFSSAGDEPTDLWKKSGVLSFFSGDVGGLKRGSYVLLKPPAAASLSQQQQSSPNSKSHLSGAGGSSPPSTGAIPHHIVGNGTESVVAGLCRNEAAAGIVSNFDLKNLSCEIILIGRDIDEADDGHDNTCSPRKHANGRRSLTVRALRTPLSDVAMAQEVQLLLDDAVPVLPVVSLLAGALDRLQHLSMGGVHGPSDEELLRMGTSNVRDLLIDLQVLRSCTVILSDKRVLSRVLEQASYSVPFQQLLKLAVPESCDGTSRKKIFLSSLPSHDATHEFLMSILRESLGRVKTLKDVHDIDFRTELETCRLGSHSRRAQDCEERSPEPLAAPRIPAESSEGLTRSRREDVGRESEAQVSNRSISQSTGGSNSDDDEESEAAAATAAAHLREAAIAQMSELGLPREWSELALRRTGGTNIEAAVTFCLERSGDMERLLSEERERDRMLQRGSASPTSRRRGSRDSATSHLLRQLQDMGFPGRWCAEALAVTGNNVDEALTWILTNGERLSEEDEGLEAEQGHAGESDEAEDESLDEDEDDEDQGATESLKFSPDQDTEADPEVVAWTGSVLPLRFISGRANIDHKTLQVSGLPTGGFTSVGTKGVLLTSGKWYYEAVLETAGCLQIGWADASFAQHCNSDRGDGCGDGPSSWSFDGWRRYRWHCTATEWGCRWKEGDVVGCLVDMDQKTVSFHLNGKSDDIGMGIAFSGSGFRPVGGVYACVSFNRKEKLRLILGGRGSVNFKYEPPSGYRGVGEAVLASVDELNELLDRESVLDSMSGESSNVESTTRKFLCDFSDGEHGHELMAWAHRYYGSDASVHLGSAHSKLHSQSLKSSTSKQDEPIPSLFCTQLAEKVWIKKLDGVEANACDKACSEIRDILISGYVEVATQACWEIRHVALSVSELLARKLALHLVLTMGSDFNPLHFVEDSEESLIQHFWKLIEDSTSLRSVGWVGEAGAMAVAAEALGLGITSTEQLQPRSTSSGASFTPTHLSSCDDIHLPSAGITQFLSTVLITSRDTDDSVAAVAEAAIGSDSGGALLSFLRLSIQSALCHSCGLRNLMIASIRRAVRLLAVVEYEDDQETDGDSLDDAATSERNSELTERSPSTRKGSSDVPDLLRSPDARLATFFSGLLLSHPLRESKDFEEIEHGLAECWSVGLLSASLPWRMICAFTLAGVLSDNPRALQSVLSLNSTLTRFFGRLPSSVCRRVWAERAANPVCSRYAQSMIELLASVKRAVKLSSNLPEDFLALWGNVEVDSATPIPFDSSIEASLESASLLWEAKEGFVSSDSAWEVWIGTVELLPVNWKPPNRSGVRAFVDAGQGPPRLDEGGLVLRGVDWNERCQNEDGHDKYEVEKGKYDKEKQAQHEQQLAPDPAADEPSDRQIDETVNPAGDADFDNDPNDAARIAPDEVNDKDTGKKKKRKVQAPKLAVGTVLSVEPWNGVAGMARRVRWSLTGETGIYRYGGAGGKFDISHVETNSKGTRVKKRYPLPETAEQCAARHGFGAKRKFGVLLRVLCNRVQTEDASYTTHGILEWPDFGSAAKVSITIFHDGRVLIKEETLLFGSKDSGWEARFGQPSYEPGTEVLLNPTNHLRREEQAALDTSSSSLSQYDELLGDTSFEVRNLRDRASGSKVTVRSEMRFYRSRRRESDRDEIVRPLAPAASSPLPLSFDMDYHAPSISLSHDGRTASCTASDGRCTAFASLGFTKGVHYWEIKLEQADIGSVFVGVAEKPNGSSGGSPLGSDTPPRLNRWHGWGFVNFRATYASGAERVYGAHCHSGDTIGVLLDCDAGRVSFFFDGLKYGEHIMNDLGCAFESLSPFGFNVDGCGSGGTGQGAPSGFEGARGGRQLAQGNVRPRTLWPVIGLRNQGDRVTLSAKWSTCYGVDSAAVLRNVLKVDDFLYHFATSPATSLQPDLLGEAYSEYCSWRESTFARTATRCSGQYPYTTSGMSLILDATPQGCAAASAGLGLPYALLAGDRVRLTRSAGRILELAEEAVVLGSYQGRLYYRIVSQKSEGGSLTEGGGRAWFWDESEVVDGLPFVKPGLGLDVPLPRLDRFRCLSRGGLRVIYEGGAVLRSDLEIFDGSTNLGTAPLDTVFPQADVLERRVNSAGVVRYRVRYNDIEGWISARIRGNKDEMIVEPVEDSSIAEEAIESFPTTLDCALKWHEIWERKAMKTSDFEADLSALHVHSREHFEALVLEGVIPGMPALQSDALLTRALNAISNFTATGDAIDCPFRSVCSALSSAVARSRGDQSVQLPGSTPSVVQAVCTIFATCPGPLPSLNSMVARIAVLKAFNRRLRHALPWLPLRPCQEGSAILGGQLGLGTSVERAGRSRVGQLSETWVQVPSIATRLRTVRSLVFSSVKREFLLSITESTTTPTPLSHDEYELPREIRTVRINRLKAARAMESDDVGAKRKYSVFAQLQSEIRNWGGAALRRGYVAKGHGGQKRAFKVKLVGEGVNDYSGPYREVFTDAVSELTRSDPDGRGDLGVLDSTPNHASGIGESRDLLMFSLNGRDVTQFQEKWSRSNASEWECLLRQNFASVVTARDESSREVEDALVFLGRITGTAFRHGIPLDLPLAMNSVWKSIAEDSASDDEKLKELDYLAHRLRSSGSERDVQPLLQWQQRMLNSFVEGLGNVLPLEVFPLFTGEELRDTLCGNPEVDVDLLKRVVEYEGYDPEDAVIEYFWQTLREISNDERKQFLQFVWARNRLPIRESDFEAPFKIQKDAVNTGDRADQALPSASTCFFSLTLPPYSRQEILKAKLLFAINNVTTMETDFQTNSAEISEGYRALS